ncbi:SMI1/KNR4 family protein [Chitinophaga flava]|uniref:SMI1/KNR4 family protein n=1 Tax=Chitinophaga flava TaxID=2259036 RepID=UPI000DE347A4|nr:SMI1/KNR4 family protein [Chitinophaga flava]
MFPEAFEGKADFLKFYLARNGGYFRKGCRIYRDHFYDVSKDGYTSVEVESFHFIPRYPGDDSPFLLAMNMVWERKAKYSSALKDFCKSHVPFAGDGSDNDYWLDLQTGLIKSIRWEESDHPDDAILIAPSFYEFCTHLQAGSR